MKLKVVDVAPATAVNPLPLFTIHCTVGVGFPLAAAVNVAVAPAVTVTGAGFVVTTGADGAGGGLVQPATNAIMINTDAPRARLAKRSETLCFVDFWSKFRILETINAFDMAGLL